jgi:Mitochondrial ribosomal protein L37
MRLGPECMKIDAKPPVVKKDSEYPDWVAKLTDKVSSANICVCHMMVLEWVIFWNREETNSSGAMSIFATFS